jgi:hypothetical protein
MPEFNRRHSISLAPSAQKVEFSLDIESVNYRSLEIDKLLCDCVPSLLIVDDNEFNILPVI